MNVAILGTEQPSQIVAQLIEQHYNPWLNQRLGESVNVAAYVGGGQPSPNIGNVAVLNPVQFALLYHRKVIDKIIFPREIYVGQVKFLPLWKNLGIDFADIFIANRLTAEINALNFIESFFSAKYMPYLEFRIADHCNMNCSACAEFSGLVKEPKFPVFEKFAQDIERLSQFINDIGQIRILGGEPLLNPEINKYIKITRQIYPYAIIHVVTNGLLLHKMPDDFFDTIRENNAAISISFYKPLESRISEIHRLLQEKNVVHFTNMNKPIEKFFLNQSLRPKSDPVEMFWKCEANSCRNLWQGKITTCYKVSAIDFFNDYFHQNLPNNSGALDLYSPDLTTEKIKTFLVTPFELCRYCTPYVWVDWKRISHPSPITDWTNDHLT